ncbi:MAG TPA: cation-translocating P-type ATPase [Gammaproteobacteria bacterium]|nr:cation-translocating P-type ATPase [Gammaproteobacteria bacterium]
MNPGSPISSPRGLTASRAAELLTLEGYNELPSARPRSVFAIAINVAREPMFLLLVACGAIYLLLGNRQEALMLLAFVFVVMGITFIQERKAERTLEALRDLSSPRALVIRDGVQIRIAGREVVRGDIVVLSEGDRVPADGMLLESKSLTVDESLLTGESVPVRKLAGDETQMTMGRPGGDDSSFVFSGTLVTQGKGLARVLATGDGTAMGHIGKSLASIAPEATRIQREITQVVKRVAWFGSALAAGIALWYGVARADPLNGFLAGLTFAMAILPEELPVVLTIFLGLGAWRIAKEQVLTRRVPAVEMLGAATVLCVDKTGTLTQNRMTLAQLAVGDRLFDVAQSSGQLFPEEFHETLEFAVLASHRDPFDPTEKAIRESGLKLLAQTEHLHADWQLVEDYPLSGDLLAMSRVWRSPGGRHYVIAAKGSPEAIADLCHLNAADTAVLTRRVNILAGQGLRVLGVAKAVFVHQTLPEIQHDFEFRLLGLIALDDPLRPTAAAAIAESLRAGLRVVMITGDYPATALSVARQIGLDGRDGVITGPELGMLGDSELQQRIKTAHIFCRVVPEQKLRLVDAFKADGEIVAMTGDGVNDAPALKAAHIGIAMGGRGTDVARESASLVLLDDDFSSIVSAVKLGRRIFDNLRKAFAFVIAVHVPIVGMSLIPVMMGWPIVLMPVHILFLQLIIDPACSIVFEAEPEEADVMRRPPRSASARLFDRGILKRSFTQGFVLLAVVLSIFSVALMTGRGANEARALTFTTMVLASIGLIFANRSWSRPALATLGVPNAALWWITIGAAALLGLILYLPALSNLFLFGELRPSDLALCLIAGLATFIFFELSKLFRVLEVSRRSGRPG